MGEKGTQFFCPCSRTLFVALVVCIYGRRAHDVAAGEQVVANLTMTTIQPTLPEDPAKRATEAGLLSAEAIQEMLQEKPLRRAGESLRAIRDRMPDEELTPEIEQESVEAVRAYWAEKRWRRMG